MVLSILSILGFGHERESLLLILRFIRNPLSHLSNAKENKEELVSMFVFIERVMVLFKLIAIFFFQNETSILFTIDKSTAVILFIFAKQIAQISIWFNGHLINLFVRIFSKRNNLIAAQRAYAFSMVAPHPILYAYTLSGILKSFLHPLMSSFIIYGICFTGGTVLLWIGVVKQYHLSFGKSCIVIVGPTLFSVLFIFQVPFYFIAQFSPPIVKKDIDLSILEFTEFDVDSSRDGALYLQNFLLKTGLKDTLLIDSLLKTKKIPDDRLGKILAKHYEEMSPLLHSTYFNKKNIVQAISGVPIKPEIAPLGLQPQFNYHRYLKSMMLYFRYLLKKKDYTNAFILLDQYLQLCESIGESNLGLVPAITSAVYAKKIMMEVENFSHEINNIDDLISLSEIVSCRLINIEWFLNGLRIQYNQDTLIINHGRENFIPESKLRMDSIGFWIPQYVVEKFFDHKETVEIQSHVWARILYHDKNNPQDSITIYELEKLKEYFNSDFNKIAKLIIYKNPIGRVLALVGIQVYKGYALEVLNNKRYMEFILSAIILKEYLFQNGSLPIDLNIPDLSSKQDNLEYLYSFCLKGDTLISVDTTKFTDIYKYSF